MISGTPDGTRPNGPYVGDVIHYVSYGTPGGEYDSVCRAAIVTATYDDDHIGLCVLNPTGMFFNLNIGYSQPRADLRGGTWHWPGDCI